VEKTSAHRRFELRLGNMGRPSRLFAGLDVLDLEGAAIVAPAFVAERLDLLGQVFRARAAIGSAFRDIALVEPPQIFVQTLELARQI
jgi:hypothetical protein